MTDETPVTPLPRERDRRRPVSRSDESREATLLSEKADALLLPASSLRKVHDIQAMTHVLLPGPVWAETVQLLSQLPYGQVRDIMRRIEGGSEWYRREGSDTPQE